MMSRRTAWLLAASLGTAWSCSAANWNDPWLANEAGDTSDGGSSGDGGFSTHGLPAAQACAVLNQQRCAYLKRCGLIANAPAAVDACIAFFEATYCSASKWPALVEARSLAYDAFVAQACAAAFDTRSCEDFQTLPSACGAFLSPNAYLGQRCYGNDQCREGVCRGTSCPGRCSLPGALLDPCEEDDDCEPGLYCNTRDSNTSVGRCAAPRLLSEPCAKGERCAAGLHCSKALLCEPLAQVGQPCFDGACVEDAWCSGTTSDVGTCQSRGGIDAGCSNDRQCQANLLCAQTIGRCVASEPLSADEPCLPRQTCGPGLVCAGLTDHAAGSCQPPQRTGESCATSGDCRDDLACAQDAGIARCGPRRANGASCSTSRDCQVFSRCALGKCQPLPFPGEACLEGACAWGMCQAQADGGTQCIGTLPPGDSCFTDRDCGSGRCLNGSCAAACAP